MHRIIWTGLAAVCGCLIATSTLIAQPARGQGAAGTISGVGVAVVERQPDVMRMDLQLSAEGKDAKEAIAKLKELETAARKKLAELGAAEASIKVNNVQIGGAATSQQQQMAMMMRQRMGRGAAPKAATPAAPSVTATAALEAEWGLKGSGEERAVIAYDVAQKVKAADLSGAKSKPRTPEEEEQMEEMMAQMEQYGQQQPLPGAPAFFYISRISDEEQATALADAFKKARDHATRLAKAAGAELGSISAVNSSMTPEVDYDQYGGGGYGGANQRYAYRMMMQAQSGQSEPVTEAIGTNPAKVAMRITVSAAFNVK